MLLYCVLALAAAATGGCCTRTPPKAVNARIYGQSFSSKGRKNTAGQALALAASAFNAGNSSVDAAAPRSGKRLAYCVTGQARGFNPVRELGRALAGGDDVDVFAVIEANCMPHFCSGDVRGRINRWLHEERVERANAIITVNGTYAASSSMDARSSSVGAIAEPPSVHGCTLRQDMRRAHHNWPSTFWHQQMRAQQCFRMVKEAEARRGVPYDWVVRARPEFASDCVCPPASRPLSPSRIYSIDACNIREKAPLLCDAFWLVPRRWADVVFNAVDGWADCGAYKSRFPCHDPSGLAPECMLTAWLVDHGIPRSAFGDGTELRELGIVRNYGKRTTQETLLCNGLCKREGADCSMKARRLCERAARAESASRYGSKKGRGTRAISTGVRKQRLLNPQRHLSRSNLRRRDATRGSFHKQFSVGQDCVA